MPIRLNLEVGVEHATVRVKMSSGPGRPAGETSTEKVASSNPSPRSSRGTAALVTAWAADVGHGGLCRLAGGEAYLLERPPNQAGDVSADDAYVLAISR